MLLRVTLVLFVSCCIHRQIQGAAIATNDLDETSVPNQSPANSPISDDKDESLQYNRVVTADSLKQMMWKKCATKGYLTCMKLVVAQMVDRLDASQDGQYPLLPGITIVHTQSNGTASAQDVLTQNSEAISKNNISEVLDQYLMGKISTYLENLSLNVKILDDGMVGEMKSLVGNGVAETQGDVASGRAKSKKGGYKEHFLMAAIASGGTLIALAFKTIALLAGKALITSLISLAIAAASALKGHHHSEPKSTTYEIVTKPIVTHTDAHHGTGGHGGHDALEQSYAAYKRSIDVKAPLDGASDKVVYRIHTTSTDPKSPVYIPIDAAAAAR
ncbi:hypothetical protein M8J77_002761 [Diaphorina citri]|nr:hypothetical protein M8J77_002761 [Diaphorina citri]